MSTWVEGEALVDGTEITLTFEREQLSAGAGCNTLFGGFQEIAAGTLIADQLAQTQMACDDALQAQDAWLSELLRPPKGPAVTSPLSPITLSDGEAILTLSSGVAVETGPRPAEERWRAGGA